MKKLFLVFFFFLECSLLAARLISTSPAITESIFDLDQGGQLVGISNYCRYPEQTKEIPKIGSALTPNYEAILKLKPDLVLIQDARDKKIVEAIKKLKLKSLLLRFKNLRDILESYKKLSIKLLRPEKGEKFLIKIQEKLNQLPQIVSRESYLVVISSQLSVGKIKGVHLAGKGTYFSDILEFSGLQNAVKGSITFPIWDREKIIQSNPGRIFLIFPDSISKKIVKKNLEAWNQLKNIKAVKNKRVHVIHGDFAVVPGPRILKLIETFGQLLSL